MGAPERVKFWDIPFAAWAAGSGAWQNFSLRPIADVGRFQTNLARNQFVTSCSVSAPLASARTM
jgi:hypothetical protein